MSLLKKKKNGSAFGRSKKKKKQSVSTTNINNSLPPLQQTNAPVQEDTTVLEGARASQINPNIKRKRRVKKRKKPSFFDRLGFGKNKNRQKKTANVQTVVNTDGQPKRVRVRKKRKRKPTFWEKLGLDKKKKQQVSNIETKNEKSMAMPADISLTKETTAKPKKLKGKKQKKLKTGNDNKKVLKLIVGVLFTLLGLALAFLLLLPLVDDVKNGSLLGTVTGNNVATEQQTESDNQATDNQVTLEVVENKEQTEEATATEVPTTEQASSVETKKAQLEEKAENLENKAVTSPGQGSSEQQPPSAKQQLGEQFLNSQPTNSNPQIKITDEEFLELSDTRIYRDD